MALRSARAVGHRMWSNVPPPPPPGPKSNLPLAGLCMLGGGLLGAYGYEKAVEMGLLTRRTNIFSGVFGSKYTPTGADVTETVYFDMEVNHEPAGRVVLGLYGKLAPLTVENFRHLCLGDRGATSSGITRAYKHTSFHRIIPNFMIQGGDFTAGNGTGGESIWGGKFDDENLTTKHTGAGTLAMANSGRNTNGSQFYITTADTDWLDGKHVVVGRVVEGMEVVERLGLMGQGGSGKPSSRIRIASCGVLQAADPAEGEGECTSVSGADSAEEEEAEVRKMLEVEAVKPYEEQTREELEERLQQLRQLEQDFKDAEEKLPRDAALEVTRDLKLQKKQVKAALKLKGKTG